jgi:hypothetical protein
VYAAVRDPAGRGISRRQTSMRTMRQLVVHLESRQFMEKATLTISPPHDQDADTIVIRRMDNSAKKASQGRRTSLRRGL